MNKLYDKVASDPLAFMVFSSQSGHKFIVVSNLEEEMTMLKSGKKEQQDGSKG